MTRPRTIYRRRNGDHIRVKAGRERIEVEPVVLVGDTWTRDPDRRCSTIRRDRLERMECVYVPPRTVYEYARRALMLPTPRKGP